MSKKAERIMFRVAKGALIPADDLALQRLRQRGYALGEEVACEVHRARNPGFWRLAHGLGTLIVANLDSFDSLDSHRALKRVQWEANIACDEMGMNVPGMGLVSVRIPRSLSFENMEQGEFYEVYTQMCRYIRATYWPQLPEGEVERMAELMTREAA